MTVFVVFGAIIALLLVWNWWDDRRFRPWALEFERHLGGRPGLRPHRDEDDYDPGFNSEWVLEQDGRRLEIELSTSWVEVSWEWTNPDAADDVDVDASWTRTGGGSLALDAGSDPELARACERHVATLRDPLVTEVAANPGHVDVELEFDPKQHPADAVARSVLAAVDAAGRMQLEALPRPELQRRNA